MKRPAVLKLLYGLVRATTEDLWKYFDRLKAINDGGKLARNAGWMEGIRSEVNAVEFNGKELSRFGDLLNNPCEISNATILEFREYPVVRMVKAILQEAIYRPAYLRLQQAKKWISESQFYTEKALQQIKSDLALSHNFKVSLLNATELCVSSDVTCLSESLFTYNVTLAQGSENDPTLYVCTCKLMWDTGRLWKHALAVFVRLGNAANVGNWNLWDTKWVILKEAYLDSSYFNQYSSQIPSLSTPHVPDPDVRLKTWDIVSKQGRPKKRSSSFTIIKILLKLHSIYRIYWKGKSVRSTVN